MNNSKESSFDTDSKTVTLTFVTKCTQTRYFETVTFSRCHKGNLTFLKSASKEDFLIPIMAIFNK
jgi:hypothetical protein